MYMWFERLHVAKYSQLNIIDQPSPTCKRQVHESEQWIQNKKEGEIKMLWPMHDTCVLCPSIIAIVFIGIGRCSDLGGDIF